MNLDLVQLFKKLGELYTEEQIVHSIKEDMTPKKSSLSYIVAFEASEILEERIDKISKSIEELLDRKQFTDSVRVQELKKDMLKHTINSEKYQILVQITHFLYK